MSSVADAALVDPAGAFGPVSVASNSGSSFLSGVPTWVVGVVFGVFVLVAWVLVVEGSSTSSSGTDSTSGMDSYGVV